MSAVHYTSVHFACCMPYINCVLTLGHCFIYYTYQQQGSEEDSSEEDLSEEDADMTIVNHKPKRNPTPGKIMFQVDFGDGDAAVWGAAESTYNDSKEAVYIYLQTCKSLAGPLLQQLKNMNGTQLAGCNIVFLFDGDLRLEQLVKEAVEDAAAELAEVSTCNASCMY